MNRAVLKLPVMIIKPGYRPVIEECLPLVSGEEFDALLRREVYLVIDAGDTLLNEGSVADPYTAGELKRNSANVSACLMTGAEAVFEYLKERSFAEIGRELSPEKQEKLEAFEKQTGYADPGGLFTSEIGDPSPEIVGKAAHVENLTELEASVSLIEAAKRQLAAALFQQTGERK